MDEIIFILFPALQTHKRRAANTREIFLNNDPFTKDPRYAENKPKLDKLQEQSQMHITASVNESAASDEQDSRK